MLTYILAFCRQVFIFLTTKFDRRIFSFHLDLTRHFSAAECTYKSTATCSVNVCVCVCMYGDAVKMKCFAMFSQLYSCWATRDVLCVTDLQLLTINIYHFNIWNWSGENRIVCVWSPVCIPFRFSVLSYGNSCIFSKLETCKLNSHSEMQYMCM